MELNRWVKEEIGDAQKLYKGTFSNYIKKL